jgi:hypothetical protein
VATFEVVEVKLRSITSAFGEADRALVGDNDISKWIGNWPLIVLLVTQEEITFFSVNLR